MMAIKILCKNEIRNIFHKKMLIVLFTVIFFVAIWIGSTLVKSNNINFNDITLIDYRIDLMLITTLILVCFLIIPYLSQIIFIGDYYENRYELLFISGLTPFDIVKSKSILCFLISYLIILDTFIGVFISCINRVEVLSFIKFLSFISIFIIIPFFYYSFAKLYGTFVFISKNVNDLRFFKLCCMILGYVGFIKLFLFMVTIFKAVEIILIIDCILLVFSIVMQLGSKYILKKISVESILNFS
jgi:hypothetical protein